MKKMTILFAAALLLVSTVVFAFVDPGGGGKFCKNNPTSNTGTCTYNGTQVSDCLTTLNAIKDCYGLGAD